MNSGKQNQKRKIKIAKTIAAEISAEILLAQGRMGMDLIKVCADI